MKTRETIEAFKTVLKIARQHQELYRYMVKNMKAAGDTANPVYGEVFARDKALDTVINYLEWYVKMGGKVNEHS